MSRFTISPSFPLLSLLPLSSLLDDPSLSPPPRLSFCPSSRVAVFRFFTPHPTPSNSLQPNPPHPASCYMLNFTPHGYLCSIHRPWKRVYVNCESQNCQLAPIQRQTRGQGSQTSTGLSLIPQFPGKKKKIHAQRYWTGLHRSIFCHHLQRLLPLRGSTWIFFPGKVWVGVRTSWWV